MQLVVFINDKRIIHLTACYLFDFPLLLILNAFICRYIEFFKQNRPTCGKSFETVSSTNHISMLRRAAPFKMYGRVGTADKIRISAERRKWKTKIARARERARGRAGKHKFWMLLLLSGSLTIFGASYVRIYICMYNRTYLHIYTESACVFVVFWRSTPVPLLQEICQQVPELCACIYTIYRYIRVYMCGYIRTNAIFVHKAKQHSTTWHLEHMETGSLSLSFSLFI